MDRFHKMRREDRQLDIHEAKRILQEGAYGVLSTVGDDGYAYGVPLNYVYYNDAVYFHCATEGSKLSNIRKDNRVSFCVVGHTEPLPEKFSYRYESTILFGEAREVQGKEKIDALLALVGKYSPEFVEKGTEYVKRDGGKTAVIKIVIEHMAGKTRM